MGNSIFGTGRYGEEQDTDSFRLAVLIHDRHIISSFCVEWDLREPIANLSLRLSAAMTQPKSLKSLLQTNS